MSYISGTDGDDVLLGTIDNDIIRGGGGQDVIDGIYGADQLYGDAGNDIFRFSSVRSSTVDYGMGIIDGGLGFDTIDLASVGPTSFSVSNNMAYVTVGSQRYSVTDVENILLGNSTAFVTANLGYVGPAINLVSGYGNDFFSVNGPISVASGSGDDFVFLTASGSSTVAVFDGGAGQDRLGLNIGQVVDIGAGTVRTVGQSAGPTYLFSGFEIFESAAGDSTIYGDANDNTIRATNSFAGYSVHFYGAGGNDTLTGHAGNDYLDGGSGVDTISGGLGDDVIDGGTDRDTVIVSARFTESLITRTGQTGAIVVGPDGTDTLQNVETIRFSDGFLNLKSASALFDGLYYAVHNADVFLAQINAETHYGQKGWLEGRDPNALFSTSAYLAVNADVRAAGINPLAHFDSFGWQEGRDASAAFDTTLYLLNNPDVAAAGIDPFAHFLTSGQAEGRQAYAAIGTQIMANGFDPEYYLLANADVAVAAVASGKDVNGFAFEHYQTIGWHEGRDPNALFDTSGYISAYSDVAAAGINPLDHFSQFGWKEGRDPSISFDTSEYMNHYQDVAQAGIDPMLHYLQSGAYETRSTFSDNAFDL
jgi:Ca2+-binding RTX toxin-like protein